MSSPFAAGCAALLIDALQSTSRLTGDNWDFSSNDDVRLVKMLLCATATETNANREVNFGYNPTLERASDGPRDYPAGKDLYEGYGMLNVDAAIEAGTVIYTAGATVNQALGGGYTAQRAWGRAVQLSAGVTFDPTLTVPTGADFDLYLYSTTPGPYGTPVIITSSTNVNTGEDESISYTPGSAIEAVLVVKLVSGSGTFGLTSTPDSTPVAPVITSTPVTAATVGQLYNYDVEADGTPDPNFALAVFPDNMIINPDTGLIEWLPDANQIGDVNVVVEANNTAGFDTQSFTISVAGVTPEIISAAVTNATAGQLYSYDVDANGLPVPVFSLIISPNDMVIDPNSGLIEWLPDANQIGDVNVVVEANNIAGFDTQKFTITVFPSDNFNDNRRSAMWRLFAEDYDNVWLIEDANRLNIRATGEANDLAAFYSANGWEFDVNESFAIQVDFHYGQISYQDVWLGMIVENDDSYVSILAGSDSNMPYFYYETIVDGNTVFERQLRDPNDGTLYISYDIDSNDLYLSHTGYGSQNAYLFQTIPNPLRLRWTSPPDVAVGGGSDGVCLDPGDAYLDGFGIITAGLVGWPPATDLDEDGFIDSNDLKIIAQYWLTDSSSDPNLQGDINYDNIVNLLDLAELGLAW